MQPAQIVEGIKALLREHPRVTALLKAANPLHAADLESTGKLVINLFKVQPRFGRKQKLRMFFLQLRNLLQAMSAENDEELAKKFPYKSNSTENITISLLCAHVIHIAWMKNIVDKDTINITTCLTTYQEHQKSISRKTWLKWEYRILAIQKEETLLVLLAIQHADLEYASEIIRVAEVDLTKIVEGMTPREHALRAGQLHQVVLMDEITTHIDANYIADEIIALTNAYPKAAAKLNITVTTKKPLNFIDQLPQN